MKIFFIPRILIGGSSAIAVLAGVLVLANSASAQVTGINANPSGGVIQFDDTNSFNASLQIGSTYFSVAPNPSGSGTLTLPSTMDLTTSDTAQGNVTTAVTAFGNYSISLNNVTLDQASANSGYADLTFQFTNQFQLGASGLGIEPVVYPDFAITGTIQNGGFASVTGLIKYIGTSTPNGINNGLIDTVFYSDIYTTANTVGGILNANANGIATSVNTPLLDPNSTLGVIVDLDFRVDPADITVQTVPEPGSGLLLSMAALGGLLWRKCGSRRTS